jgi:hypothetical protein
MIQIIIRGSDQSGEAAASAAGNVRGIGDEAEKQGGRLRGFFAGLKTVIAGAAIGVAAGIGVIATSGLSMNNAMEQSSARIQAFTKDSEATAEILEMVRDRAAKTPFAFNEMSDAAANLLPTSKAAGKSLEELLEIAEVLAASNPAEGLQGAAFALKEAASGDFTSIIERFNLPRQRLKELREQGVPDLEAVQIAMKELGLDTDLVTGLANTAQGRWSTFMDTLQNLAATLTKPIFDAFSSGLGQVQTQIDANMPAIQAFADGLAVQIGNAIQWLIGTGIPMLIAGWAAIQPALATAQAAFAAVMAIIGPIAAEIMSQLPGALAAGQEAFTQLGSVVQERMAAIQAVISSVLPIITGFWAENGASIVATVQTAFTTIVQIISTVSAIINQLLLVLAGFFTAHGALITSILTAAWTVISGVITGALQLISGIVKAVLQLIQGDFQGAWSTIQSTAAQFVTTLVGIIEGLASLLGGAIALGIAAIEQAWAAFLRAAPGFGGDLIAGIAKGISEGVGALKSAVESAANAALQAAKEALGIQSPSRVFAVAVGLPIAQGMAEGIQRGMPLVQSAGSGLASAAAAGAMAAQRVDVNSRSEVSLTMSGGLDQLIDARIDNRLSTESRRGVDRGMFS